MAGGFVFSNEVRCFVILKFHVHLSCLMVIVYAFSCLFVKEARVETQAVF